MTFDEITDRAKALQAAIEIINAEDDPLGVRDIKILYEIRQTLILAERDVQLEMLRERAPCRDVARLVVEALTDEPQHISKIAAAIGVSPSRVLHTLERTAHARRAKGGGGWVRGDGDHP